MKTRWITGKHTVEAALKKHPEAVQCLYIAQGKYDHPLVLLAEASGIKVQEKPPKLLSKLAGSDVTQGFVAKTEHMPDTSCKEFLKKHSESVPAIFLAIDSVEDPQNFGGILRAGECFGAAGVIYSHNRGSSLSATASKASCGASELVPLLEVANLASALRVFQEQGYMVATTAISEKAENAFYYNFAEKMVLVLGAEGKGVRPLLHKLADCQLYLPMSGEIDSLNVAGGAVSFLTLWKMQWQASL